MNCIHPLGLESGFIPDEALSHSVDTANTKSNPTDIRLNKDVGEFPNGWQAALRELDYLQVIILNERLWNKQTEKKTSEHEQFIHDPCSHSSYSFLLSPTFESSQKFTVKTKVKRYENIDRRF